MQRLKSVFFGIFSLTALSACMPAEFTVDTGHKTLQVMFYPGGDVLDDLMIIDGKNYFGKAQHQMGDPLSDIGFRFKSGKRVRAECVQTGKNILGENECKLYEVFRSDFELIPKGSRTPRLQLW